jgi:hypothetical protein
MLLAIDPGADMGWARFDHGRLVGCGVGGDLDGLDRCLWRPTRVVLERPMIYPHGRQKARPRDVITLALRAGERAGLYGLRYNVEPEYFEPDEWKGGSISKEAHHPRVWKRLADEEKRVASLAGQLVPEKKHHNMLDAIGIGLFALGINR